MRTAALFNFIQFTWKSLCYF